MEYFLIVDKIKDKHISGVYGRRKLDKSEKREYKKYSAKEKTFFLANIAVGLVNPLVGGITAAFAILDQELNRRKTSSTIILRQKFDDENRILIFDYDYMQDDFDISEQTDLFYGAFDELSLKDKAFEKILKSHGGSRISIIERSSLLKNKHFGGKDGKFSYGLYSTHPKDENVLIPLKNSSELIKNLILEETLRAYEALGAKKIKIEQLTKFESEQKASVEKASVHIDQSYVKELVREKEFGKGTFDPERALSENLFIHDFPNIMTTIKARINGNQLSEKFTEIVDISAGLDIEVLNLFSGNINFFYQRKWSFEVSFYDKNDI